MAHSLPHARRAGKRPPPTSSVKPASSSLPNTLHLAAHRLASNLGVPFGVAMAHAEAAGLGREVRHG
ncbi:hypothetical protein GGQ86_004996 [Xanthobacter flavus]|uniref:Uncharacterized protein n=1 Tax=Xanthobacter flavus TaxID=281 RepID=A0A9W6CU33_XANFL|nr:hypothetical protein [Xanthobacter flavus]MDR6336495.1 hypothetical protein [Xanthobacter flavus]GLI25745.1 hypothetical protein XFLAVUS301_54190 [Xanthobacter flavus]